MKKLMTALVAATMLAGAAPAEAQITGTLRLTDAPRLATTVAGYTGQGGGFAGTFTVGPVQLLTFNDFLIWCVDPLRNIAFDTDFTYTLYNADQFAAANPFAWADNVSQRYNRIADGVDRMIDAGANQANRNAGQKISWDAFTGNNAGGTGSSAFNSEDFFILVKDPVDLTAPFDLGQTFMFERSAFRVPEPASMALVVVGLFGLGATARRRRTIKA